jgi:aspartate/methionine/tyrosine aminotransferase
MLVKDTVMRDVRAARVAGFGTTIFTEMSALAVQHSAVNLGQGFPDFAGPAFVKEAAAAAVSADLNQYAPMPGLPRLRRAIAADWESRYGRAVDWQTEVSVTSGATEALCDAMLALLNPGDRAIIFEPAYDAYVPDIIMAGAVPVPVRLYPPRLDDGRWTKDDGKLDSKIQSGADHEPLSSIVHRPSSAWHFDPYELRAAFEQRPKLVLINTPHNPTGKVFTRAELELIASLCQEFDVIAVTDEVYDRLVFGGHAHVALATLPGMWERTLTLNSIGKTFSVTGWKIGWSVGPAHLNQAIRAAHQWVTFATSTPMQEASAVAIELAPSQGYYAALVAEYEERRTLLVGVLEQAGLPQLEAHGSYFISCDVSALGFRDTREFCLRLVRELGVAAIPISAFYMDPAGAPPLARFCFAKKLETISAAGERLQKLRDWVG